MGNRLLNWGKAELLVLIIDGIVRQIQVANLHKLLPPLPFSSTIPIGTTIQK